MEPDQGGWLEELISPAAACPGLTQGRRSSTVLGNEFVLALG